MHYVVIAHDHDDEAARQRRIEVRPEHMERCERSVAAGTLVFAVALLDDDERMIGSAMVVDLHGIWGRIDITRGRVGPWFPLPEAGA